MKIQDKITHPVRWLTGRSTSARVARIIGGVSLPTIFILLAASSLLKKCDRLSTSAMQAISDVSAAPTFPNVSPSPAISSANFAEVPESNQLPPEEKPVPETNGHTSFFNELSGNWPIPIEEMTKVDPDGHELKIVQNDVCPGEDLSSGNFEIIKDGRFVGNLKMSPHWKHFNILDYYLFIGIRDLNGQLIGFRSRLPHVYADSFNFLRINGEDSHLKGTLNIRTFPTYYGDIFLQDETHGHEENEKNKLGRYDDEKGTIYDNNERTIATFEHPAVYLFLSEAPMCQENTLYSAKETTILKFPSFDEFQAFKLVIAKQAEFSDY